jgi:hypothetical protein
LDHCAATTVTLQVQLDHGHFDGYCAIRQDFAMCGVSQLAA